MDFKKLSAPTLKELFITELENMILSGELEIGSKLPSERELAASMQVSRAVVNSGIAEMEKKGFLVVKPRIGTFVEDYRRNGTLDTLVSIMNYNGGTLKKREIRSILEARIVLDTLAVKLTIQNATDEAIDSLKPFLTRLSVCTRNEDASRLAFDFHHELGFISGNTLLPLFFVSFKTPVICLWSRFCQEYGIPALYENTLRVFSYLKDRDEAGAISFIERSLRASIDGDRQIYN